MRIEKKTTGEPKLFSTEEANFTTDERTQLRMIRSCHPTVSEFFFADHVFLVEGETEQAVLNHALSTSPPVDGTWCHVVNCMGKANLPLFARILNHFGTTYTIIHDADAPMSIRNTGWAKNGMWTINKHISDVLAERDKDLPACRLIGHIPDFEGFYFHNQLAEDKPYHAITVLNSTNFQKTEEYRQLIKFAESTLEGKHPACYADYADLVARFKRWRDNENPIPPEKWEVEKHD